MSLKNRHEWNWQPTLPIKLSPILDWPPNFLLLFKWLASYWLHISSIIIEVLLAIFIFYLFHPSAEEMKNFSFSWISQLAYKTSKNSPNPPTDGYLKSVSTFLGNARLFKISSEEFTFLFDSASTTALLIPVLAQSL